MAKSDAWWRQLHNPYKMVQPSPNGLKKWSFENSQKSHSDKWWDTKDADKHPPSWAKGE